MLHDSIYSSRSSSNVIGAMEDSGNLADLEAKIATLERSEFQLKMQVFYLHKKLSESSQNAVEDEDLSVSSVNLMEDRSVDVLTLREDLDYAKRRIVDLESEVLQLQLLRDNEALEFQKLMQLQPSTDVALLEDSRRREREVAKTIAEHDGALITQLQSDLATLQTQHDRDATLVEDCTSRLADAMEQVETKDLELLELRSSVADLTKKVGILTDTARQQEQLLSDVSLRQSMQLQSEATEAELESHRIEIASLKEQLELQKTTNSIQTEALVQLRAVASEMGQFENDELSRLGAELGQCHVDKDRAQLAVQKLEHENLVLQRQLNALKGLSVDPVPVSALTTDATGAVASVSSFSADANDSVLAASAVAILKSRSNDGVVNQAPQIDPRILDNYRQREADLLAALESLIVRCQDLELQAHERDEQQALLQHQLFQQAQQVQQLIQLQTQPARTMLDNSPRAQRAPRALSVSGRLSSAGGSGASVSSGRARSAGPDERTSGRYDPATPSSPKQRAQRSIVVHTRSFR